MLVTHMTTLAEIWYYMTRHLRKHLKNLNLNQIHYLALKWEAIPTTLSKKLNLEIGSVWHSLIAKNDQLKLLSTKMAMVSN